MGVLGGKPLLKQSCTRTREGLSQVTRQGFAHQHARQHRKDVWKAGLEPDLKSVKKTSAMTYFYTVQSKS